MAAKYLATITLSYRLVSIAATATAATYTIAIVTLSKAGLYS